MSANTNIEWTDHTFNPWIGCTKVSPGCAHCYAETLDRNRYSKTLGGATKELPIFHWGPGAPRIRTKTWKDPVTWNRQAAASLSGDGPIVSPRVFCASLADWLDPEVPAVWLAELLELIWRTPHLDWQLLTKRPQLWRERVQSAHNAALFFKPEFCVWLSDWLDGTPPANVWIGTTTEDQTRADERIPAVLEIPARVRFLSCEPLLSPVDLASACGGVVSVRLDWVIVGGESGPGARPMHVEWARSLEDQCAQAGVAFFFKQWGDWIPQMQEMPRETNAPAREVHTFWDGLKAFRVGKINAGRLLDGVEYSAFPSSAPSASSCKTV